MTQARPLVGITADVAEYDWLGTPRPRAQSALTYSRAVADAGGLPLILPPLEHLAPAHVEACDALVLSGGDDPIMEAFGGVTHPAATPMHPLRQAYELALLAALDAAPRTPVLGICLGMQLMSLHAGGRLNQCLAESLPSHADHVRDAQHRVEVVASSALGSACAGPVASNHRQGVEDPGRLRLLARAADGVIEAVDDPARPFYAGVQWHPERTGEPGLGADLFRRLVQAASARRA